MKLALWSCVVGCVLSGSITFAQATGVGEATPATTPQSGTFGYAPTGTAGPPANPLFDAIDADRDGTISTRELRKAVATLKRFDVDRDGKITRAETLNNQQAMPTDNTPAGAGAQGGFRRSNGNGFGGVNGDPRPAGPNLLQFDRNGDGQVSADEMPTQMRGMMRGGDQNGDGRLDAGEIANIQQRINERVRGDRSLPPGVSVGPQGVSGAPR
jgi:hypothetical protein